MEGFGIVAGMTLCALVPFFGLVWLARAGQSGWVLTILAVLGAALLILIYATAKPFGIEPVRAMALALLVFLPAVLGGGAGALLGKILRNRDDRRAANK